MAPCLEVLVARCTEAYRDDPSIFNPVLEIVAASKGCIGIYHGIGVEDPSILLLLISWATFEDHQALINDKERYSKMSEGFANCADLSSMDLFHIYPDFDLAPVLNSPFVSFVQVVPAKPETSQEVYSQTKNIATIPLSAQFCYGGGLSKVADKNSEEYILLHGWEDPKYHAEAAMPEPVQQVLKPWYEVAHRKVSIHVKLIVYKKHES